MPPNSLVLFKLYLNLENLLRNLILQQNQKNSLICVHFIKNIICFTCIQMQVFLKSTYLEDPLPKSKHQT